MLRTPPDILITTPESLFLLLTSQARETLRGIETVILDEVHAVAGTKRGAHLALSLERLERLVETPFQRVGLSATQRPMEEIGRFVAGTGREIQLVDAGMRKELDLQVVVPVEDMRELGSTVGALRSAARRRRRDGRRRRAVEPLDLAVDLPRDPRARPRAPLDDRLRQQPAARRAARAPDQRARGRGARARAPRLARARAAGRRRGAAQGRADPVPRRDLVARARHRHGRRRPRHPGREPEVGRARPAARRAARGTSCTRSRRAGSSRSSGPTSSSRPSSRGRCARARSRRRASRGTRSTSSRSRSSRSAPTRRSPSTSCTSSRAARIRSPSSRARSSRTSSTCSPAATRPTSSPSCGRASSGIAPAAPSAGAPGRGGSRSRTRGRSPTAASSACSSPTAAAASASSTRRWSTRRARGRPSCSVPRRGGSRTSRATASSSRRLPACPASLRSGRARASAGPPSSARRSAETARELSALADDAAIERVEGEYGLDALAARNLVTFLREQEAATGVVPSDRTIVVERFRDEIGDWRVCILSPFGGRVHAPWAMALRARLRDSLDLDVQSLWSDDGIALHFPDADSPPPLADLAARAGRDRGSPPRRARAVGAVRRPLPRERGARSAHPAPPARASARRCGSSG